MSGRPPTHRPKDGRISQSVNSDVTPVNRVRRHIYLSAEIDDYLVLLSRQRNTSLSNVIEDLARRFGGRL